MKALTQKLTPSKKNWKLKELTIKIKEEILKEWTSKIMDCNQKPKDWKMMSYLLIKNEFSYIILPP